MSPEVWCFFALTLGAKNSVTAKSASPITDLFLLLFSASDGPAKLPTISITPLSLDRKIHTQYAQSLLLHWWLDRNDGRSGPLPKTVQ